MSLLEPALQRNAMVAYSRTMDAPAYGGGVFRWTMGVTSKTRGEM